MEVNLRFIKEERLIAKIMQAFDDSQCFVIDLSDEDYIKVRAHVSNCILPSKHIEHSIIEPIISMPPLKNIFQGFIKMPQHEIFEILDNIDRWKKD